MGRKRKKENIKREEHIQRERKRGNWGGYNIKKTNFTLIYTPGRDTTCLFDVLHSSKSGGVAEA